MGKVKIALVVGAVLIAAASLVVSHSLVNDLAREERKRMEVWAEAMRSLISADNTTDLNLVLQVLNGNTTIPVIVQDEWGQILEHRNLSIPADADSLAYLKDAAEKMRRAGNYMEMSLSSQESDGGEYIVIGYEESVMLRRLASYPYVQLGVVGLFVVVASNCIDLGLAGKSAECGCIHQAIPVTHEFCTVFGADLILLAIAALGQSDGSSENTGFNCHVGTHPYSEFVYLYCYSTFYH